MINLKKTKRFITYSSIIFFSLGFSIILSETYLYNKYIDESVTLEKRANKAKDLGLPFDTRSKFEVINDFNREGIKAYPTTHPIHYLDSKLIKEYGILPLSGLAKSFTVYNNENGHYVTYQSDRYGFNNNDDIWNENEYEYVFVGDSFVHGAGVEIESNLVGSFYKKTKIFPLNLGIGGNGPLIEYATLKEYLDLDKTKNLIWFYYEGNDLNNLLAEKRSDILINYFNNDEYDQELKKNQKKSDEFLKRFIMMEKENYKVEKNTTLLNKIKGILKLTQFRKLYLKNNVNLDQEFFYKIIDKVTILCQKNDINFYFVYIPSYKQLSHIKNKIYEKDIILKNLQLKGIDTIDIKNAINTSNQDITLLYPFGLDGHFNDQGNSFIVDLLIQKLDIKTYRN